MSVFKIKKILSPKNVSSYSGFRTGDSQSVQVLREHSSDALPLDFDLNFLKEAQSKIESKRTHRISLLVSDEAVLNSVTRKKSPNLYKSCPKMISLEK